MVDAVSSYRNQRPDPQQVGRRPAVQHGTRLERHRVIAPQASASNDLYAAMGVYFAACEPTLMPRWRDPVMAQGSRSTTQARANGFGIR